MSRTIPNSTRSIARVELPLIDVLADLEYTGVRLDVPFLAKLSVEMKEQLADAEDRIHALAGQTFNIASPLQLREILFEKMKLPVQKRTDKTNEPSTDQESLERLAALGHDLPTAIIEHRQIAKLKGTYVDALPELVNPKTGRLHTSFNQTVASTGRLSSSDPNLQNVPMRTEQGRQIRQAFIPRDGWVIVTADYSQVELRLLAHFCGDENLRAAFAADQDIHAAVAAKVFKVAETDVTKQQRGVAKMVNFGVIYGISAHGLAIRLGIPRWRSRHVHRRILRPLPEGARLPGSHHRHGPDDGPGEYIVGPEPVVRPGRLPARTRRTTSATRPSGRRSTWRSRAPPRTS